MANANAGYTVNMRFNADVSRAKQQIMDLETSLRKVANVNISNVGGAGLHLTKDLQSASLAATQLAQTLNKTMNMNTGKLDLTLFNRELQKSGMTLQKYQQALSKAGPAGQQAFMQLTQSITLADMKTVHLSDRIMKLGRTLGNTLRWQISTTILNGMINSVSTAYRYTKDLNESLNEIRIVTGYSVAQMDKFADKANKAAKALATTTNEYAKASLIYFQQGLSDEEVEKRTNLTIKMANVTGKSAQEVSDQLTAIWNNFYDGTESLEHYIDVVTALGAATASSSEEISQGLNKFAAVAETVGLSYEYAASALATVTATTRESADVVGNAFKTLFARIQGLQLGETLDDGTTLNKYSTALAKVGIDIQTASGEMKDMDAILNEMGAKWETLSQAQQTALAQTVGGVRQYTHLVSLMENWDYFKENLSISMASDGTLDKQAKIYEESWEAARDKVTAALEDIYKKLLDDDAFIGILNFFEKFLNGVSGLIDGLGGLHGVLLLISSALTTIMQKQVAGAMASAATFIRDLSPKGQAKAEATRREANQLMVNSYSKSGTTGGAYAAKSASALGEINETYLQQSNRLSETQKAVYDQIVQQKQGLAEATIKQAELADEAERQLNILMRQAKLRPNTTPVPASGQADLNAALGAKANTITTQGEAKKALLETYRTSSRSAHLASTLEGYVGGDSDQFKNVFGAQRANHDTAGALTEIEEIQTRLKNLGITANGVDAELEKMLGPEEAKEFREYAAAIDAAEKEFKELAIAEKEAQGKPKHSPEGQRLSKARGAVFGDKTTKGVVSQVNQANNAIATRRIANGDVAQAARNGLSSAAGMSTEAVDEVTAATNKSNEAFEKMVIKTAQVKQGVKDVKVAGQELEGMDPTQRFAQGMTALGSTLSSTAMAISSIIGLFKVWNNEDMSFGDKLLSTFTTLGVVIPMVTMALNKNNIAQLAGLAAAIAHALGLGTEATAASIAAGATATFGTVLYTVLWPIGLVMLAVAALVGVVFLLVKAFQAMSDAYNADAIAAEKANKQVETLTESYNNLKNAADELKSSISDYSDALKALDELEQGTDDYKEKLEEVNAKAKELIETYGLWDDYNYENGVIRIDADALERAQDKANDAASRAETLLYSSKIVANEANLKSKATNLGRDMDSIYDYNGDYYRDFSSEEIMSVADAMIDLQESTGGVEMSANQLYSALKENSSAYGLSTDVLYNLSTMINTDTIDSLYDFVDSINEASKANKYYAEQIFNIVAKDEYSDYAKRLAKDTEGNIDETKYNQILNAIANNATETTIDGKTLDEAIKSISVSNIASNDSLENAIFKDDQYDEATRKLLGDSYIDKTDMNDEETALAYAKLVYGKDGNYSYKGGWGEGTIKDLDTGETLFENMNDEDMRQYIARAIKQQAITDKYASASTGDSKAFTASLEDMVKGAEKLGEKYGTDFSGPILNAIANQNFNSLDMSSLYSQISPKEHEELMKLADSPQDLMKALGLTEEDLKTLGYTSTDNFISAFKNGMKKWDLSHYVDAANKAGEEAAKAFEVDEEEFKAYRALLLDSNEAYENNVEGLNDVAIANKRLQKGVQTLADDWESFDEVLSKDNLTLLELSSILPEINIALQDILNLKTEEFSLLPPTFAKDHWGLIQDVVHGVEGAVDRLRNIAGQEILLNITGEEAFDQIEYVIQYLHSQILAADENKDFEVGVEINDDEFIRACNGMLAAAKMTSEEATAYFASLGYDVDLIKDKDGIATAIKVIKPNGSYGGGMGVDTIAAGIERDTKVLEDELERYHEINERLSDLNRAYDIISDAKNRAFGQDKLNLIDAEIEKTNELVQAQKDYLAEAEAHFWSDRNEILQYGASTDEYGRITNYEEMITAWVDAYNKGYITEEDYDKRIQALENYEDSLNTLEEQQKAVIDAENQLIDLAMEKIEFKVELKVKVIDNELTALEYQLEQLDDPFYDAASALNVLTQQIQQTLNSIDVYRSGIRETLGEVLGEEELTALLDYNDFSVLEGKSLTGKQVEMLEQYRDALYDSNRLIDEFLPNIHSRLTEAFEAANEEMQDSITNLEHLGSIAETYENIIDIVGQDMLNVSNEVLRELNRAGMDNAMAQLKANSEMLEFNRQALVDAQAARETALREGNTEAVAEWDKSIKTITERVQEMEKGVHESLSSVLQKAADDFEKAINAAANAFEKAMSGIYGSFEQLQKAFDQQNTLNKRYAADYKKIYELSKLSRDITNSIDETDNIKAKRILRDLETEILDLQESSEQVSEYRLDYLRKEYELRLAQIALEEAQNAKNQVRMQRDTEGNWSYVYTANEDKISEARQNYEDALYAIQEYTQKYIESTQETILQLQVDYVNDLKELRLSDFANIEEYEAAKARITEYYSEMISFNIDELDKSIANSADIYYNDWKSYSEATNYKLSENHLWITDFEETILAQTTGFKTLESYQNAYSANTIPLMDELSRAFNQWSDDVNGALDRAGLSVSGFNQTVHDAALSISGETENITNAFSAMVAGASSAFSGLVSSATAQSTLYKNSLLPYKNANQELIDQLNAIIALRAEVVGTENPPVMNPGPTSGESLTVSGDPIVTPAPEGPQPGEDPFTPKYQVISTDKYGKESVYVNNDNGSSIQGYSSEDQAMEAAKEKYFANNSGATEASWNAYRDSTLKTTQLGAGLSEGKLWDSAMLYSDVEWTKKWPYDNFTFTEDNINLLNRPDQYTPYGITFNGKRFYLKNEDAERILLKFGKSYSKPQQDPYGIGAKVQFTKDDDNQIYCYYTAKDGSMKQPSMLGASRDKIQLVDSFNYIFGESEIIGKKTVNGVTYYQIRSHRNREKDGVYSVYNRTDDVDKMEKFWVTKGQITPVGFDTGGYTGSWDSSGRLAMLHQKEIVLNADDTVNFLNAIEIVRDIARVIDLNAASQANAFNMIAATSSQGSQILEQQVTIHAEFPNATNRTEIEAAFDNLVNKASQFANRKNK